jgi:hypothetical protein
MIKVTANSMSPDEFRQFAVMLSKWIDFTGCNSAESIEYRITNVNSKRLNYLKYDFGKRFMIEICLNPHTDYMKILKMSDKEYKSLVNETMSLQDPIYLQLYNKQLLNLNKKRKKYGEVDFVSRYKNRLNKVESDIEKILVNNKYPGIKV